MAVTEVLDNVPPAIAATTDNTSSLKDVPTEEVGHRDYAGARAKSDPAEIRLVRKLDLRVMPIIWLMYFFNYVDRGTLAQARLNDLEEDLGMSGNDFNVTVSILVVGYVLMQVPSNELLTGTDCTQQMILTRVRPSLYLAACMGVWSAISACTGLVSSYGSLVACRFLLGFFEAPFYPGALYLLAVFYTRKEVAARIAILFTAQMAGLSFANLIAAGVFAGLDGKRGLSGWRWLFILEGVASALVALLGLWLLPDTNETTRWLSPEERAVGRTRMDRDRLVDAQAHEPVVDALRNALKDKRLWLFCGIQNFHYVGLSFTNFLPTVIKDLSFTDTVALVLACPPYIFAGVASLLLAYSSGRFHERTWHITIGFGVAIVGFVAAASTENPAGRYVACFIFPAGTYAVNSVIVGWVATTLSQSSEKKAVALAITNVSGQIAQIYGAYLWPSSDGPRYLIGFCTSAAFALMSLVLSWVMRFWLKRENQRMLGNMDGERANIYAY
ncbi:major facilitator superfamily domain-containing protein [Xylariomycetidae sp. FL2044]|nr:major facilitator superfamily domain-containing protein [Xylariomycetidae sp. FL2044]